MRDVISLEKAVEALRGGDPARAVAITKVIVAHDKRQIEAWRVLGVAANRAKDFDVAERAFAEAALRSKDPSQDLLQRTEPLVCLGRPAEAASCVREAVRLGLTTPRQFCLAALALSHIGLPADSLPLAEKAVALDPSFAEAWMIVGNARLFLGDVEGAQRAFDTVIASSRDNAVAAYHGLAYLKSWSRETNHIAELEKFRCRSSQEACRVGYALFKEYDDVGDFEAAWDCLQHAARVGRVMESWSADEEARNFEAWKTSFPSSPRPDHSDLRPRPGPRRIFVVGLPRSGTTLVERILTAHSQVQAIGEVNTFAIATRRVNMPGSPGIISPEIIAAAAAADALPIAVEYTRQNAYLSDGSAYTVDKRPDNYEYIGLIKKAFPDAIIVSLDRDPMDALFGAYKRSFAQGSHGWSYTFDDLVSHYVNFRDLMDHWRTVLRGDLIEASLEALIAQPEQEIRRLIDACGLPFEDDCLTPHKSANVVMTASALQVRRPINAEGVGAWRRYAYQLAPLRDRLIALGYAAATASAPIMPDSLK